MTDILIAAYPWIKAFHVMAVLAWMAGLFLPAAALRVSR